MKKRRLSALFLALLLGIVISLAPRAAAADRTFSDVKPGAWYYDCITAMARAGYVEGYPNGRFGPNDPVTFGELLTIAVQAAGAEKTASSVRHWAAGFMQTGLSRGWYDWDECPPEAKSFDRRITRQVAVKIVMKALLPEAKGDYNECKARIRDFAALPGRYYETTFAAYREGIVVGYPDGRFGPTGTLTRAEACTIVYAAVKKAGAARPAVPTPTPAAPQVTRKGGVSENGWLEVRGTQLCNEKGEPVVLHGMSSHGLQWYGGFADEGAIAETADRGANLFRVAMYTGEGGYLSQPEAMKEKVIRAVDAAIRNDIYVIIDWHILSDGDPRQNESKAREFFAEMAARYRDEPAVLYEICNEPNGGVGWSDGVKPYAQRMVQTIRDAGSRGVVLIGSPTWSQDVHLAAQDPVQGENLMYTLHFYAGTHGQWLRDRADDALKRGLPIFVSEWGVSAADGSGGVFLEEAGKWLDFLNARGISWANWSLCDKNETSAALNPGASPSGGWKDADLSPSGKFVFSRF